jgi:glycosyltransferase involved in cell wall biosynthesis
MIAEQASPEKSRRVDLAGSQKRLKVGYLSSEDPTSRWSWSGIHYFMFSSLRACGLDVWHLGRTLLKRTTGFQRLLRYLGLPSSSMEPVQTDSLDQSRGWGSALCGELARSSPDVIFAPVASRELAFLETKVPIVYLSDATFRLMHGYYASFSHLPESAARALDEIESRAMSRSRRLVYSSSWAADSAIADYGALPDKVRVVPFGANLDQVPSADAATQKPRGGICRLLFLGRDWERKGGSIAFDCLVSLVKSGVDAELIVCGCTPPPEVQHQKLVVIGLLDKMKRRQRQQLYRILHTSHFLVLPSRADCTPIVFCEANAFGLPVISTRTGGIPSIIEHGRNGLTLPLAARGADFAQAIAEILYDQNRYQEMVTSSRRAYEERLNWNSWARSMHEELSAAVRSG